MPDFMSFTPWRVRILSLSSGERSGLLDDFGIPNSFVVSYYRKLKKFSAKTISQNLAQLSLEYTFGDQVELNYSHDHQNTQS